MDVLKQKIKVRVQVHSIETVDKLLLEKSAARWRCRNLPSTRRCSTHVIMNQKWKILTPMCRYKYQLLTLWKTLSIYPGNGECCILWLLKVRFNFLAQPLWPIRFLHFTHSVQRKRSSLQCSINPRCASWEMGQASLCFTTLKLFHRFVTCYKRTIRRTQVAAAPFTSLPSSSHQL